MKRSGGINSGKNEVNYISPNGIRIKSKAELASHLGNLIDLTTFDFRTGKINANLMRKNRRPGRSGLYDYRTLKQDHSLTPPIRQNLGIFKKPLTVTSTQPKSVSYNSQQIKEYYKRHNMILPVESLKVDAEKPYQLFWQKRLEGLQAKIYGNELADFQLPPNMKAFMNSLADNDSLLRSITTSLYINGSENIKGQEKKALVRKQDPVEGEPGDVRNPVAFVDPQQPLIISTTITEDDVRRQEEAVADARNKLTAAVQDLKGLADIYNK